MQNQAFTSRRYQVWLIGGGLVVATLALFGRSVTFDFLRYDDPFFISNVEQVRTGLSLGNVRWAFDPRSIIGGNWHPVTMITHMADCEFFGLNPGGHHAVNVVLHALNTLLLFWALVRLTGDVWPAALVAALFSWHPLHVESVAWVSERKDVLSTCFWFATLIAYWHYARRPSWWRYALVAGLFCLGLLSKPMVVTLPATLLLLDWWPLRRFSRARTGTAGEAPPDAAVSPAGTWRLVLEKLPLFACSAAFSLATVIWQDNSGALARTPITESWKNASVSYWAYLGKMAWPKGLAALYPLRDRNVTVLEASFAVAMLVAVSALAVYWARRRPYFSVGWFWYVGTMLPVIGLIQVAQSMADRYTYVPLVGIFIILAWGGAELAGQVPSLRYVLAGAAGIWLAVLAGVTWNQLGYWKDTMTLFSHALEVTNQNFYAHYMIGNQYIEREDFAAATAAFDRALAIKEEFHEAHHNKGVALLLSRSDLETAIEHLGAAIKYGHNPTESKARMAECLARLGRLEEAERLYTESLVADTNQLACILGLGTLYTKQGRYDEAINLYRMAFFSKARSPSIAGHLAWLLATCPEDEYRNGPQAVVLAEEACRASNFRSVRFRDVLAAAYAETGRFDIALEQAAIAPRMIRSVESENAWTDTLEQGIAERISEYQLGRPYRSSPADASWDDTMVF